MKLPRRIFLVGHAAVGKSTTANLLARRLCWRWTDTDDIIQTRTGVKLYDLIVRDGGRGFRNAAFLALREAIARPQPRVIATGAGMPSIDEARRLMRREGFVVWLDADRKTIERRAKKDAPRAPDTDTEEDDWNTREKRYGEVAHFRIDTDTYAPRRVVKIIMNELKWMREET